MRFFYKIFFHPHIITLLVFIPGINSILSVDHIGFTIMIKIVYYYDGYTTHYDFYLLVERPPTSKLLSTQKCKINIKTSLENRCFLRGESHIMLSVVPMLMAWGVEDHYARNLRFSQFFGQL